MLSHVYRSLPKAMCLRRALGIRRLSCGRSVHRASKRTHRTSISRRNHSKRFTATTMRFYTRPSLVRTRNRGRRKAHSQLLAAIGDECCFESRLGRRCERLERRHDNHSHGAERPIRHNGSTGQTYGQLGWVVISRPHHRILPSECPFI